MTWIDIVILVVVLVIIGLVVYFAFIKNRKNPCASCSHKKNCAIASRKKGEKCEKNKKD